MNDLLRILDANANRAREGLRVLEDIARFMLNDAALAERCKRARHVVSNTIQAIGIDDVRLIASRDTAGDVGASIKVDSEQTRTDLPGIIAANAMRATEALRVLSEVTKLHASKIGSEQAASRSARTLASNQTVESTPAASASFEHLRYESYEIQRNLTLALGCGDQFQPKVCVLITESLCTHHSWHKVAELSLAAGADMIQLREKSLECRELLSRAIELVAMCRARGAKCVINDRVDIALLSGAWGVHVGQQDLTISHIRSIAGKSLHVGVSTESMDQAIKACVAGADYCGVGPMFPTTTKDKPRLAGPAYLREYVSHERTSRTAHLAIGGITIERMPELIAADVRGVAVSSVVCGSREPGEVVARMKKAMNR